MRASLFVTVSLAALLPASAAFATRSCPTPAPAPQQAPTVTPATSSQSASTTAGLISERVVTTVSGYNNGSGAPTTGNTLNIACGPSLNEASDAPDALEQALGATTGTMGPEGSAKANAVWAGGTYNRVRKGDTNGRYNGGVGNGVVGYDRRVTKDLLLGIATGYETVDIQTEYNQGSLEGSSVSLAPYLGYAINDWLSADFTLGYSWIHYDFTRNSNSVRGSTAAGRIFGSTNLTASHRYGDFNLRTSLGYLRVYEHQNAYRESDGTQVGVDQVNFGQIRGTIGGGYDIVTGFGKLTPNAFVRLEYDVTSPHSVMVGSNWESSHDRTGAVFGLGVDAVVADDLLLNVTVTSTQFRQNTEGYTLMGNVRYNF